MQIKYQPRGPVYSQYQIYNNIIKFASRHASDGDFMITINESVYKEKLSNMLLLSDSPDKVVRRRYKYNVTNEEYIKEVKINYITTMYDKFVSSIEYGTLLEKQKKCLAWMILFANDMNNMNVGINTIIDNGWLRGNKFNFSIKEHEIVHYLEMFYDFILNVI